MCGVAGIVTFMAADGPGDAARTRDMMHAMRHRGPDDEGVWQADGLRVTLGHLRLAILDLSENGHQPMTSASGRYTIVFNGEIYNHAVLRASVAGYPYRGHSDTEVLLASIEAFGVDETIARAAGMFAIALYDSKTNELVLARDRAGEKPLFFALTPTRLVFSSEIRSLLASRLVEPRLRESAVTAFLTLGYQPTFESLLEGIYQLPPGTILRVKCAESPRGIDNLVRRCITYWRFQPRSQEDDPKTSAPERLERTLRTIMPEYLAADVPVGVLLSGGMDSSIVALAARRAVDGPIRTYTASFPGTSHDEVRYAQTVAERIGAIGRQVPLTDEAMREAAGRFLPHTDFPIANPSYIPLTLICEAAREDVTVCVSGDGGDEVFGGYNRYWRTWQLWQSIRWMHPGARATLAKMVDRMAATQSDDSGLLHRILSKRFGEILRPKIYGISKVLRAKNLPEAYLHLIDTGLPEHLRNFDHVRQVSVEGGLRSSQSFQDFVRMHDFGNYLPGDNLAKADQASMRVSLELRLPLLDERIARIGMALPVREMRKHDTAKWPIAALLSREFGSDFVRRPKMGFSVPLERWLAGALGDWARQISTDPGGIVRDAIGADTLDAMWSSIEHGHAQAARCLWAATALQAWWTDVRAGMSTEATVAPGRISSATV